MMKNMGGAGGGAGELPDSDDEEDEEEAPGEPMKAKGGDGLGDLEEEVVKNPAAEASKPAEAKPAAAGKKEEDDELD